MLTHAPDLARLGHPSRDEGALVDGERRDRTTGEVEVEVLKTTLDVILDLRHQRRHQVEGLFDGRVIVE